MELWKVRILYKFHFFVSSRKTGENTYPILQVKNMQV